MTESTPTYCANHPATTTNLRCNRCEKLICSKCAIHTPTGYRCKDCVRNQQKTFDSATWYDYPIGFIVAGLLSYLGSLIVPNLGFFVFFLAPLAGVVIAEATRFITRKRRSRPLFITITAGAVVGSLPTLLLQLISLVLWLPDAGISFGSIIDLIWHGAYIIMLTSTGYYRISGLVFGK